MSNGALAQTIGQIAWTCVKRCKEHSGPPVMCLTHQLEAEDVIKAELTSLATSRDELAMALKVYGQHLPDCGVHHKRMVENVERNERGEVTWRGFADFIPDPQPCTCGFLAALATLEAK